ncbi:MBL fold metallo-hydrolase [Prevotella intermedia]|uniref:MBL fold metallo-hydrolase n=1 Tax=Prevotella intermedia TaxID=28131 RepID=UPI0015C86564|nr:MBL fold metallo-hydrolase [Prevotella intermedia]
MNFRRTFYPVGQGAFYVEEFRLYDGSTFTIVYDCGSTTLETKDFEAKIEYFFRERQGHIRKWPYQIDILFISHFHADHINGIKHLKKHCNIKKVVIPLIDDEEKAILKVSNYIEDKEKLHDELIDNPEDFFGENTTIIRINTDYNLENQKSIDISEINDNQTLSSGTILVHKEKKHIDFDWVFIPFNYKQEERIEKFKLEIDAINKERKEKDPKNLSLAEMDNIEYIKKNKKDLIKAYRKVEGDLNKTSMVLYSGPRKYNRNNCYLDSYSLRCVYNLWSHCLVPRRLRSGCLYTGDINLNEDDLVKDINEKLDKVSQFIGTLQIPHHGSWYNFNESILKINELSCVIFSFGTKNRYGHPAFLVLDSIVRNRVLPYFVTERGYDIVVQEGFFL